MSAQHTRTAFLKVFRVKATSLRIESHVGIRLGSTMAQQRVAVLYQALEPPVINGVRKPKKPGGYQDSGADIAYVLQNVCQVPMALPVAPADAAKDSDWSFPDTEDGILSAVRAGATHIWANTILFATHPLQTSGLLAEYAESVSMVGQPPQLVEAYDDKALVYKIMKSHGGFTLPRSATATASDNLPDVLNSQELQYPLVGKPIRGRGSHGVKLCKDEETLQAHARSLFAESPRIIVEEYLNGEEATVTVMPPSASKPEGYWALPIVTRFNHSDGIAPYNGSVAVTSNSRVVQKAEYDKDLAYEQAARECEQVAALLKATAPIRIDIRRFKVGSKFALFDVNMKPNMTGPGRPGRDDQASLTAMAAEGLGWSYGRLLSEILTSAQTLATVRKTTL
ncbi:glutathione synthetase ATP-binding domain-like protein [Stagonosporopsis vannaccii]|nr:glutathione synthetase ATP-binding domain-like protein [Stagonosporopsis vannaccii]